ncbi:MAG: beta-hexosaminidase [Clostridiales bacterium]|nr:beta-hexosaminidase [Clostridiales bacterium]
MIPDRRTLIMVITAAVICIAAGFALVAFSGSANGTPEPESTTSETVKTPAETLDPPSAEPAATAGKSGAAVTELPQTDAGKELSEAETAPKTPETADPNLTQDETVTKQPAETAAAPPEPSLLDSLTLEEKLGLMFMVRYSEETAGYPFGSYILFAKDFENETPESIAAKLAALRAKSKAGILTAVDEEGGTVVRISRFPAFRSSRFLSPRALYAKGGMDAVTADTAEKAQLLHRLGISMNLAPVADISDSPDDFMYKRSVGLDAAGTSEFVRRVIETSREYGVLSAVKHFPGYGGAADTHTGMVRDSRSLETLLASDLIPFKAAVEADVGAIMLSHIIADAIDKEKPVSVSEKAVAFIRDEMGYDGVIITDDLGMEGITAYCRTGSAALEAVMAGCDLLCCSSLKDFQTVLAAVKDGRISEERINQSAARILGLIEQISYD